MTRQLSNYSVSGILYNPDSPFHILYVFTSKTTFNNINIVGNLFQLPFSGDGSNKVLYNVMIPVYLSNSADNTLKSLDGTNTNFFSDDFFPCVNPSVFKDELSFITFLKQKDSIEYLLPPKPCQNDSTVYCCPNVTGPKMSLMVRPNFFDTKTVIMMLLILGLVAVIYVVVAEKK